MPVPPQPAFADEPMVPIESETAPRAVPAPESFAGAELDREPASELQSEPQAEADPEPPNPEQLGLF